MAAPRLVSRFDMWTTEGSVALIILVHLGMLVAIPAGRTQFLLLAAEAVLLVVLVGIEVLAGVPVDEALLLAVAFVASLTVTAGLQQATSSISFASILLVTAFALLVYGGHRYELVLLGLVDDE